MILCFKIFVPKRRFSVEASLSFSSLQGLKRFFKPSDIIKQATLAYQRSVNAHGNVLMNLVANKRSKEDVENKHKSQEHINCHHLLINFNKVSNFHLKIRNPPKKLHSEWSLHEVDGKERNQTDQTRKSNTLESNEQKLLYKKNLTENQQRRWRDRRIDRELLEKMERSSLEEEEKKWDFRMRPRRRREVVK
ncbi:hypothetical protein YC2023_040421 [Brassica napus]